LYIWGLEPLQALPVLSLIPSTGFYSQFSGLLLAFASVFAVFWLCLSGARKKKVLILQYFLEVLNKILTGGNETKYEQRLHERPSGDGRSQNPVTIENAKMYMLTEASYRCLMRDSTRA